MDWMPHQVNFLEDQFGRIVLHPSRGLHRPRDGVSGDATDLTTLGKKNTVRKASAKNESLRV